LQKRSGATKAKEVVQHQQQKIEAKVTCFIPKLFNVH
jgi:hypothetical protein